MPASLDQLLASAAERAQTHDLPYAGALLPAEAHALFTGMADVVLVDVRTQAEIDWVGFVPGAAHVEWHRYPGGSINPDFVNQLREVAKPEQAVLFLCRSGGRSHAAAALATTAGFKRSYNVLEGFEGDRDGAGHRNVKGGWRAAGLPWIQA